MKEWKKSGSHTGFGNVYRNHSAIPIHSQPELALNPRPQATCKSGGQGAVCLSLLCDCICFSEPEACWEFRISGNFGVVQPVHSETCNETHLRTEGKLLSSEWLG